MTLKVAAWVFLGNGYLKILKQQLLRLILMTFVFDMYPAAGLAMMAEGEEGFVAQVELGSLAWGQGMANREAYSEALFLCLVSLHSEWHAARVVLNMELLSYCILVCFKEPPPHKHRHIHTLTHWQSSKMKPETKSLFLGDLLSNTESPSALFLSSDSNQNICFE